MGRMRLTSRWFFEPTIFFKAQLIMIVQTATGNRSTRFAGKRNMPLIHRRCNCMAG
jgi:hypothetical protein